MQRSSLLSFFALIVILILTGCGTGDNGNSSHETPKTYFDAHVDELATKVVERMALTPDERVLLVATPGRFDGLISKIREGVAAKGAVDLGCVSVTDVHPDEWATDFVRDISVADGQNLEDYLREVDLGVMMPGAQPVHDVYKSYQNVLDGGIRRAIHFHWEGAYDLQQNLLEPDRRIDSTYINAILNTDYSRLAQIQKLLALEIREPLVEVRTLAGTALSFYVEDRPVTRQDGDASARRAREARNLIDREVEIPAGAVRVAPIESTVNGTIVFPPSQWGGEQVEGLTMEFQNGKVVNWSATKGEAGVRAELEEGGEAARSFREIAIGLNPLLAIPSEDPWVPYYGYGAGVVRLSLGNNSELGGDVTGGYVRWNFFTEATVRIGGELWIENGELRVK